MRGDVRKEANVVWYVILALEVQRPAWEHPRHRLSALRPFLEGAAMILCVVLRLIPDISSRWLDVPDAPLVVRDPIIDAEHELRRRKHALLEQLHRIAMTAPDRHGAHRGRLIHRRDGAE